MKLLGDTILGVVALIRSYEEIPAIYILTIHATWALYLARLSGPELFE